MLESAPMSQKPRRFPDPLSPMPEETFTTLESTPDLGAVGQVAPTVDAETAGEPTIVPQKIRQERPSIGDWMGTWWAKGKVPNDKDPPHVTKPSNRRKTAQSVFGTLGVSILNPAIPPLSSTKKKPIVVDELDAISNDALSIKSGKSIKSSHTGGAVVLSSPIQASFVPSAAAPLISTVFESLIPPHALSTKASSLSQDTPIVITQGATLRAIANATRVMSSDPSSILSDQGRDTGPLIARLSMELIKNARDEGVIFRERPKERRGAEHASETSDRQGGVVGTMSSNPADATASLNRALSEGAAMKKTKSRAASIMQVAAPPFASPLFGSFMNPQQRKPSVMGDRHASNSAESSSSAAAAAAARHNVASSTVVAKPKTASSVPLESIIPATSKPPTQYLSRTYTPLTSRDFRFEIPLPQSASRYTIYHGEKNQRPLTDRYGFMYDVSQYDVLLLLRAKECGNTAPACLTGVKIADREEDNSWPDDDEDEDGNDDGNTGAGKSSIEIVKESCPCNGELDWRSPSRASEFGQGMGDSASAMSSSTKSRSSSKSRRRSSAAATANALSSSMVASTTSILSVTSDTPRHACANTVRMLLNQLTEIHDQQQAAQRKEWDAFVKQRTKVKKLKGVGVAASSSASSAVAAAGVTGAGGGVGAAAAAILGLGTAGEDDELSHSEGLIGFAQLGLSSNKDERREFDRLIRSGIPLVYRAKVWLESSGALEMREPGIFRDLLAEKDGPDSVRGEIEKDVGRTMPLNIFFGGDGAGVDKLRRVLIAYSRWVLPIFFFWSEMLTEIMI